MIHTYVSSSIDVLTAHCTDFLWVARTTADPLTSVFDGNLDPVVIYPNAAVRDRLKCEAADRNNVLAGVEWETVGDILHRIAKGPLDWDIYGEQAVWAIFRLLTTLKTSQPNGHDDFSVLRHYAERTERDLFDIAKSIESLLSEYAAFRPDWILAWAAGHDADIADSTITEHVRWQKALVRMLKQEGFSTDALLQADATIQSAARYWAKRRIIVFMPLSIPPFLERFLAAASEAGAEITVYLVGPETQKAAGNSTFSLYRRQCERSLARLSALGETTVLPAKREGTTRLSVLQNRAVGLSSSSCSMDESVVVIRASSLTRELETFADRLQMLFQADPTLSPNDVLMLFPDINAAVPSIHSVFGRLRLHDRASSPQVLPIKIVGTTKPLGDTLTDGLAPLLKLAVGDCSREDFISWLTHPSVMKGLSLGLDDVGIMIGWLKAAGFVAGIHPRHLDAVEHADKADDRTLSDAVERLTAFYCLGDVQRLPVAETVLPTDGCENGEWESVTDRPDLYRTLVRISESLNALADAAFAQSRPVKRCVCEGNACWQIAIFPVLATLLPKTDNQQWKTLTALLTDIGTASTLSDNQPLAISLDVLVLALEDKLSQREQASRPTDVITAGPIKMLYALPKRIVGVFGLQNGCGFCEERRPIEFDLRQSDKERNGDRNATDEDRHRMLTMLMGAQDSLHLSYSGSARKGGTDNPSCVIKDVLSLTEETQNALKVISESVSALLPRAFLAQGESDDAPSRSWKSMDARLASLFGTQSQAEQPTHVAAIPDLGRTPEGFTDYRVVKAWCMKPASVMLKALRLPDSSYATDDSDGLELEDSSKLTEYQRRSILLQAADEGLSPDNILAAWCADPTIGVRKLRRSIVERDLEVVTTLRNVADNVRSEEAASGGIRTAVHLTVPLGDKPEETLVHTIDEVWISATGATIVSRSLSSAPKQSSNPTSRGHAALYDLLIFQTALECGEIEPQNPEATEAIASLTTLLHTELNLKTEGRTKQLVKVAFVSCDQDTPLKKSFTFKPAASQSCTSEHPDEESLYEAVSGKRLLKALLEIFFYACRHPDQLVYSEGYQQEASARLSLYQANNPETFNAMVAFFKSITACKTLVSQRDAAIKGLLRLIPEGERP